ncbi:proteasome regulatory particle base subunit, partial [Dimargaris verticillata]
EQESKAMDVDAAKSPAADTAATTTTNMDMDEPASSATKAVPAAKTEKCMEVLDNMSRVVPAQWQCVSFPADSRYKPVKGGVLGGILLLRDLQPDQPQELMPSALRGKSTEPSSAHSSELRLPSPFEYPFGHDN